ncbi:hypothetical protein QJS04_geneDACA015528 [Acorus gramineus]|uniref:Eukaryotic translation initiation factor 2A n=1 Tax=Acorus gramineus TaxID=55184 RepID=A0AAV9AUA7_ACOGR|nr:hypothetical protein QJS04_geneDACA015528 [Acorus gramineus]
MTLAPPSVSSASSPDLERTRRVSQAFDEAISTVRRDELGLQVDGGVYVGLLMLAREPQGFSLWNGPPFDNGQPKVKLERVPCTTVKFSENGARLMVTKNGTSVSVYDCKSYTEIRSFEIPSLLSAALSPCGTYLQTFQKSTTPQEKNVVLWNTETGASVYQQFQKNMLKTTWPSIHFSSDESVACRMATNEIQFFDAGDFSKGIVHRLRIPGVVAMELSKSPGSHVAAFVAESKGIPASVQIFSCNKDAQAQPVARRSFFRCSTVQLHWNCGSSGLLVVAHSDVDKTNQSYYGESKLNYLTTDGSHEGLVPLSKEGPVHDVQWSSSGSEFAAVYGCILSLLLWLYRAYVLDTVVVLQICFLDSSKSCLQELRYLTRSATPYLTLEQAFWDCSEKKLLGATKAEWSVTSEWSPDGRYFMTATTAPRLQIDNGIKIFHHNGSLFFKKMFDKLYQLRIKNHPKPQPSLPPRPSRNPLPTVLLMPSMLLQFRMREMSKNALRNKKRREKQKEKKAAESA